MNAAGIAIAVSTAAACTGIVLGVMVVYGKAIMAQLAENRCLLADHAHQLSEIDRSLGRLEGRQAAETSTDQT